jgi:FkbM family methyltransferase
VNSRQPHRKLPIPLRPAVNWLAGLRGLELVTRPPNGTERTLYDALFPGHDVRVIFDIGANIGNVARQFSLSFPTANIYCFEPVAETYKLLCEATVKQPNISCFQVAVGDVTKEAYISLEQESERNHIVNGAPFASRRTERINMITIDEFCEAHRIERINIIKTDTEGYDLRVLQGAQSMLRSGLQFVLSEVGMAQWDTRYSYFHAINDFLGKFSFQLCGFYDMHYRADGTVEYANALFLRSPE